MRDKPIIYSGLAVALVALTFPFWYPRAAGRSAAPPDLVLPAGKCIEGREFMRAHHMELLDQWRDAVVRHADRSPYVSCKYGTKYEKSLTKTCMGCHADKKNFCDRCHEYTGVTAVHPVRDIGSEASTSEIGCWDCHHLQAKGH